MVPNFLPSKPFPSHVGVFQRQIDQHPTLQTILQVSDMDQYQAIPQVPHFGIFSEHFILYIEINTFESLEANLQIGSDGGRMRRIPCQTFKELPAALDVGKRLHELGMVQKAGEPQGQERKIVLHQIITGDEKWIHYDNPNRKLAWA
ncbi:hypothetical protein Trydic_g2966 [Trypoxylus dichotomus]